MHVLIIGGAGKVGGLVLPVLAQHHVLRVMDLRPPPPGPWDYVRGSVEDYHALSDAMDGVDALVFMAMGVQQDWREPPLVVPASTAFDVSVKGLHLALWAAHDRGVSHAVFTSSMSVFAHRDGPYPGEETPPDACGVYGFTKRLGEEVCRNAVAEWGLTVTVLRLCFPTADEQWPVAAPPLAAATCTSATDTAQALLAGLDHRHGLEIFTISGDSQQRIMNNTKAKRLLGWEPSTRPQPGRGRAEPHPGPRHGPRSQVPHADRTTGSE